MDYNVNCEEEAGIAKHGHSRLWPPLRVAISYKREDLIAELIELPPEIHQEVYALLKEVPEENIF
jgi:hypothetical protein